MMRKIGIVMLLCAGLCFAQGSSDFKPASSNVLDAQFPQVDSNSRVLIRFKAPDAAKVRVNFWSGEKADMEKQPNGFWTFTNESMAPGHYYTIVVDGRQRQYKYHVDHCGPASRFGYKDLYAHWTLLNWDAEIGNSRLILFAWKSPRTIAQRPTMQLLSN
jgi:hypothetical protein